MKLLIYDVEVFAYDWIVVFKNMETGTFTVIHNDNEALRDCMYEDYVYIGFNSKSYDQYIIKAIAVDLSPQEIKQVNDYIIAGGQGWQCPLLDGVYYSFNNVDIRNDMYYGLSLKAIEGHLGLPIKESNVDFSLDRPLTKEELEETIIYCKYDVESTERIVKLRKDYLNNKIKIGRLAGIPDVKAMSMTNAKLTAAMLKATPREYTDEREYKYPDNLKREYIPKEVFDYFNKMYDKSLSDTEVFNGKLKITIGECPVTIGYGGIHGAIPNYFWEENNNRIIRNFDVASYYPHLMTICGYTSRSIPSPKVFEDVLETRMKAKASGDKATANALKLIVNTTYGAGLDKFNPLYDPLMGRSVCISGQLYLLELAMHLYKKVPKLKIVQLNTDGIMIEFDESDYNEVLKIRDEWQKRTGFELEEDEVKQIAQKDVNNYVEVQPDGTNKCKGGYLVKGLAAAGAFNINNSNVIVATAVKEYLVNATPVEETIGKCEDILQFQIIAKAGSKYKEAYHLVDGEKVPVQRVNRVYATSDERYGKLYKVKAEDESTAKIEMLPEHCIIDNDNELKIEDIDKSFYIELAKKRINDFKGIKPERKKKMAGTTKNVYQKLIEAREKFLVSPINQTGKNMHLQFKYFELSDIVPTITHIFKEIGLLAVTSFTGTIASIKIVNTDKPEEEVEFTAPFNQIQPIISNAGKQATNEMQALGSSITYMRRYLYLIAMDICVNDEIEPTIDKDTNNQGATKNTAPATKETREEVKKNLTAVDDNASELQIKGLKNVLKKLKDAQPDKEEMIMSIAIQTDSFSKISKADCEALIQKVTAMLEGKE